MDRWRAGLSALLAVMAGLAAPIFSAPIISGPIISGPAMAADVVVIADVRVELPFGEGALDDAFDRASRIAVERAWRALQDADPPLHAPPPFARRTVERAVRHLDARGGTARAGALVLRVDAAVDLDALRSALGAAPRAVWVRSDAFIIDLGTRIAPDALPAPSGPLPRVLRPVRRPPGVAAWYRLPPFGATPLQEP